MEQQDWDNILRAVKALGLIVIEVDSVQETILTKIPPTR
jgi:hypothetical protein